jgi:hypothetical protein
LPDPRHGFVRQRGTGRFSLDELASTK